MEESDKILYHYTSLEGLLGITKSQSIWATNILYLNDASELNYAIGLLRDQIINYQKRIKARNLEYMFFETLIEDIDKLISLDRFSFFVCSFSEENDLLSQWRGYCPGSIGFSLGFKLNDLRISIKKYGFSLTPCIYSEKQQVNEIKKLIKKTSLTFTNEMMQKTKGYYPVILNNSAFEFFKEFTGLVPTFKHSKFKEEKEWRIIAGLWVENFREIVKFRPGKSMIVPYIEITLPKEGEKLVINQVIVGPTPEPILSKTSVEMLLKSKQVIFEEVHYSTIPYRNW